MFVQSSEKTVLCVRKFTWISVEVVGPCRASTTHPVSGKDTAGVEAEPARIMAMSTVRRRT